MFFTLRHLTLRWILFAFGWLSLNAFVSTNALAQASNLATGRDFIVAVVNASPITNHDVNQRVLQLKQQAREQNRLPSAITPSLQFALEKLITESALLQLATEQGITLDAAAMTQAQERAAAQSQLSVDALRAKLTSEGISWQSFQQNLKTQIILQRLAERNVPARIRTTDAEIEAVLRERMNARSNINPNIELAHILIAVLNRPRLQKSTLCKPKPKTLCNAFKRVKTLPAWQRKCPTVQTKIKAGEWGCAPWTVIQPYLCKRSKT